MTPTEMENQIVRYGDLIPCKTAFIDAHTPGSDQKENFTIIGGGVSESADQHVHIKDTPGFNIGAAGQPPKCRNSLHSHTTAEVFFVLKGKWRFFWGRCGDAGEVTLQEGDIINIPTGIFRGFENIGTDYGMIMAVLGGDDAGGGVVWAPQVIEEARPHQRNSLLFPNTKGKVTGKSILPKAMSRLDWPELPATAHDLRRTAITEISKLGFNRLVQDRIANHVDNSVGGIYDRHDYMKEKRQALDAWSRKLFCPVTAFSLYSIP